MSKRKINLPQDENKEIDIAFNNPTKKKKVLKRILRKRNSLTESIDLQPEAELDKYIIDLEDEKDDDYKESIDDNDDENNYEDDDDESEEEYIHEHIYSIKVKCQKANGEVSISNKLIVMDEPTSIIEIEKMIRKENEKKKYKFTKIIELSNYSHQIIQ